MPECQFIFLVVRRDGRFLTEEDPRAMVVVATSEKQASELHPLGRKYVWDGIHWDGPDDDPDIHDDALTDGDSFWPAPSDVSVINLGVVTAAVDSLFGYSDPLKNGVVLTSYVEPHEAEENVFLKLIPQPPK